MVPVHGSWYVKRGRLEDAAKSLGRLCGQPLDSGYVKDELAELEANY
jgi:hypothetical protein